MFNTPVLYKATQDLFFQDVSNDCIVDKMKKEANNQGILPSQSELLSWRANAPKIKELLTMSNVKDAFIVFEYLLPRRLQRIDCMIFGKDYSNRDNVVHIELKQWSNNTVLSTSTVGNFSVQDNYSVSALTGGCFQTVVHPSQQVRGYNGYLTHFVEVISSGRLSLTGVAYCYNYLRNAEPSTLYSDQFKKLQSEFRTYAQDEVKELAEKLHGILCNGDGERTYNKMINLNQ